MILAWARGHAPSCPSTRPLQGRPGLTFGGPGGAQEGCWAGLQGGRLSVWPGLVLPVLGRWPHSAPLFQWVLAFEIFIPLVLFFILLGLRQKKPTISVKEGEGPGGGLGAHGGGAGSPHHRHARLCT